MCFFSFLFFLLALVILRWGQTKYYMIQKSKHQDIYKYTTPFFFFSFLFKSMWVNVRPPSMPRLLGFCISSSLVLRSLFFKEKWVNYTLPTCDLFLILCAHTWFKFWHFVHLWFWPWVLRNPPQCFPLL